MSQITIRDIKTIITAPSGINFVVVKVETSEPGLYGLGCATHTQRFLAVKTAIDEYLRPLLIGRPVGTIEDIWQMSMVNGYWRNGPVLNNAVSGIDQALWDLKGKMAGMPVYELLGGKCRPAVHLYRHADGDSLEELEENVQRYLEEGYRYIRCQMGKYGGQMGKGTQSIHSPVGVPPGSYYDPKQYMRSTLRVFEHLREVFGWEIELIHDVHERIAPTDALLFAKEMEPFKLFFLEDLFSPEQIEWFEIVRAQCATPLAMGELFVHPIEWKGLIAKRLIDYIRVHVSEIGGLTPAIKRQKLCEAFGVRTAWHGPTDISPVGAAAQLHLDIASPNFGIQETVGFSEQDREVFPGCPDIQHGYMIPHETPGFGVDLDEMAAAKYPPVERDFLWLEARIPDGTSVKP